jgi:hypothetical protein
MNRFPLICISLLSLTMVTGCFFAKKDAKPKENPAIAAETDADFRQRWVDKRTTELVAEGLTPIAARAQAVDEFKVRYSYTAAAQK